MCKILATQLSRLLFWEILVLEKHQSFSASWTISFLNNMPALLVLILFVVNIIRIINSQQKMKNLKVDSKNVKLQIWDFAGNERFVKVAKSCFAEADAIVFIYDITNEDSFDDISVRVTLDTKLIFAEILDEPSQGKRRKRTSCSFSCRQ